MAKKNRSKNKRSPDSPPLPSYQSDQNHDVQLEVEGSTRRKASTKQLLEEYAEDLVETKEKDGRGPRRPSG